MRERAGAFHGETVLTYDAQCDGPDGNTHCVQQSLLDARAAGNMELQVNESTGSECDTPGFLEPDLGFPFRKVARREGFDQQPHGDTPIAGKIDAVEGARQSAPHAAA